MAIIAIYFCFEINYACDVNAWEDVDDRLVHLFAAEHSVTLHIYAFLNFQETFPLKQEKLGI